MKSTTRLHPTKNPLPLASREKLVDLLNSRLATAIDLQLQSKQAHWNVKGPSFIALHELFDQVATMATGNVDDLAERIVQLGGSAHGTLQSVSAGTKLRPYPEAISNGSDHVEALGHALAAFGTQIREGIELADEYGDPATADQLTAMAEAVEKQLWFVEAHQQAKS
ncbi:MAG: DNA starvation/stationary phase protection protein Dps [Planctomycetes bacterium]|nr:DNA starvation/stationary phase protection protein Dps [Planctomycetota bacterium]